MRPVEQAAAVNFVGEGCEPLPVVRCLGAGGGTVLVSEWELSAEEIVQVLQTGRIWLQVCGSAQPPVWLGTSRPYSVETSEAEK